MDPLFISEHLYSMAIFYETSLHLKIIVYALFYDIFFHATCLNLITIFHASGVHLSLDFCSTSFHLVIIFMLPLYIYDNVFMQSLPYFDTTSLPFMNFSSRNLRQFFFLTFQDCGLYQHECHLIPGPHHLRNKVTRQLFNIATVDNATTYNTLNIKKSTL